LLQFVHKFEEDVAIGVGVDHSVQNGVSHLVGLKLFAMVNVQVRGETFNLTLDNVIKQQGLTTAVGTDQTAPSTATFKDKICVLQKNFVSIGGFHVETLNVDRFGKDFPRGKLESLVLGEQSDDFLSLGEVSSFKQLVKIGGIDLHFSGLNGIMTETQQRDY